MPADLTYTSELVALECWCGIAYAIPVSLRKEQKRSGRSVFCPLGHEHVPSGKTWEQQERELREQLARERALRDQSEAEAAAAQRSAKRARADAKRLKTRAAAGVCPCCNRTFQQLSRHMKAKHPDFTAANRDNSEDSRIS